MRISFRAENSQTVQMPAIPTRTPRRFQILDITSEVIRDYHHFVPEEGPILDDIISHSPGNEFPEYDAERKEQMQVGRIARHEDRAAQDGEAERQNDQGRSPEKMRSASDGPRELNSEANRHLPSESAINNRSPSSITYSQGPIVCGPADQAGGINSAPDGYTTNNMWLKQVLQRDQLSMDDESDYSAVYSPLSQIMQSGNCDQQIPLSDFHVQDGIFVPGSEYLELHSTLRNHLILEARSSVPTRHCTPEQLGEDLGVQVDTSARIKIPEEEEFLLWKNWLGELAPWLDKFDNQCHFQNNLLAMARSHDHLRYAMLALSARQLERKGATAHKERSLEFYHHAIHILLPLLPTRSTAVIASCVVLCVLEMLSCAPKAWQRHLDGCAGLMEAVGINGFSGGPEQALFWCFARMDVCGGLISCTKTLIPVNHWATGDLDADVRLFRSVPTFDTFANYMVYLCAQVLDILAPCHHKFGRLGGPRNNSLTDRAFTERWSKLWFYIQDWYIKRPEEMKPVMEYSSDSSSFPKILFANPAAISGNQLYHTASLLMLQARPPGLRLEPKPRSALWHARLVCGISINNHHHGAWTNAMQPLWIAGQWMSHPSEHQEILELLERIERESGWPTQWRADDLKEFWGLI